MDFDFTLPGPVTKPADLISILEPIRARGPVFWNGTLNGWIIGGYNEVKTVLKRPRDYQNGRSPQRSAFGPQAMLFHDTGIHNRLRAVWANAVLPGAITAYMRQVEEMAGRRTDALLTRLDAGEEVDLVTVFQDFTTDVITTLMDVPDDRRPDFQRWNRVISGTAQLALAPDDPRLAIRDTAKAGVYAFLAKEMDRHKARIRAGQRPDDLVSMMVAAEGQGGITTEQVLDNLLNLFLGALDTTVRWMGNVVCLLLNHRHALAELARDPGLFRAALEETLRYSSVVQVSTRHVETEDCELAGQTIRTGDMVYFMPGVANLDPFIFPQPDRFDIHRHRDPEHTHLGFGFGMHQCLGMHLARAEVSAFFLPMLEAMQGWEIAAVDYGPSWTLWGPVQLAIRKQR